MKGLRGDGKGEVDMLVFKIHRNSAHVFILLELYIRVWVQPESHRKHTTHIEHSGCNLGGLMSLNFKL